MKRWRSLRQTPNDDSNLPTLVAIKRVLRDWDRLDQLSAPLRQALRDGRGAVQPLSLLAEGDDADSCEVFDYIEMLYNPVRRHGFTADLSPVEFGRRYAQAGS